MKDIDPVTILGSTWDDDEVQRYLAKYGFKKKPAQKSDSVNAFLSSKKLGLDITFKDEQHVEHGKKNYEEGALVLVNVRMYGEESAMGYEPFKGELPHGLRLEFGLSEVRSQLGKAPAWTDKATAKARWDFKGYCVFVTFDKPQKQIRSLSVQLPID